MATFPENLSKIKTAVLGEDMRDAIHDAVEQAYEHGGEIVTDDIPIENSNNLVKSGGVYRAIGKITETMTLTQYNQLTQQQKMDGTIRFITDVNVLPSAEGVSF